MPHSIDFAVLDWLVLLAYFLLILGLGVFFGKRNRTSEQFTAGGRSLPGWLCGLSIFATFLSSISFLALPGKSFAANWNPFVFSLSIPLAAWIAVRYFIPLYRETSEVSAYAMLERRFGLWARIYASSFYLCYQIARVGVVMYLMALPMSVIFGWDIRTIVLVTGVIVTVYSFLGGIVAVIWADAIQAIVLMLGAALVLGLLLIGIDGGPERVLKIGWDQDKFSLGETNLFVISRPTVWVVLIYGVFENIKNFGIDQSYIQRYIAAANDREAARGLWLSAWLYVPVSAVFFLIGTSLFAWYTVYPQELQDVRQLVARQRMFQQDQPLFEDVEAEIGQTLEPTAPVDEIAASLTDAELGDRVLPHFIAVHLPVGITGLLVAAIFAAAMSTVSTSLNSSATLVMADFYRRLMAPDADDRQQMLVLRLATIAWGLLGTLMALLLVRMTESALDTWWTLSSILGSGIVGIFLLGIMSRKANRISAIVAVLLGTLVIGWMVFSASDVWPQSWAAVRNPFHPFLTIVIGTLVIIAFGSMLGQFRRSVLAIGLACGCLGGLTENASSDSGHDRLNVVLIVADDLNCAVSPYGDPVAVTPNLERLARRGVTFTHAYCQQAVCNPSRSSFLTGLRPQTIGVDDLRKYFRESFANGNEWVTLPQHFKNRGYFCQNIGKMFHNMGDTQDRRSWSIDEAFHRGPHYSDTVYFNLPTNAIKPRYKAPVTEFHDVADTVYRDGQIARLAAAAIETYPVDQPFFLAVGFWRPHLPFVAPKQYWDLYDAAEIVAPQPDSFPLQAPMIAGHQSREIRGYGEVPDGEFSRQHVNHFRHGYYASISFLDAQVGQILDAIERSPHRNNTLVVFTSDHGFHIGEHGLWGKTSNFELDARVPLIISDPNRPHAHGRSAHTMAELIDLFPTLASSCGIDQDLSPRLEGADLSAALDAPEKIVKQVAYTRHQHPFYGSPDKWEAWGQSVRTRDWRYTRWQKIDSGQIIAHELYDHLSDPLETRNVAMTGDHQALLRELNNKLNQVFQTSK